jgi:hypothetical protein
MESQDTGHWNDRPVKSFDFQAPLGQYGQIREHFIFFVEGRNNSQLFPVTNCNLRLTE